MNFRPLLDTVVVKLDPVPEKEGSIILVHGPRQYTGTVLQVGPGAWVKRTKDVGNPHRAQTWETFFAPTEIKPGDKVTFFRENLEHQSGKKTNETLKAAVDLEDDVCLIRERDVLFYSRPGE